jgi:hypothetical protein
MLPEIAWLFGLVVITVKNILMVMVDCGSILAPGKIFLIISKGVHGVYMEST